MGEEEGSPPSLPPSLGGFATRPQRQAPYASPMGGRVHKGEKPTHVAVSVISARPSPEQTAVQPSPVQPRPSSAQLGADSGRPLCGDWPKCAGGSPQATAIGRRATSQPLTRRDHLCFRKCHLYLISSDQADTPRRKRRKERKEKKRKQRAPSLPDGRGCRRRAGDRQETRDRQTRDRQTEQKKKGKGRLKQRGRETWPRKYLKAYRRHLPDVCAFVGEHRSSRRV